MAKKLANEGSIDEDIDIPPFVRGREREGSLFISSNVHVG